MKKPSKKNIKIDAEVHMMLKEYCEEHGRIMGKTIERLIEDMCRPVPNERQKILLVD